MLLVHRRPFVYANDDDECWAALGQNYADVFVWNGAPICLFHIAAGERQCVSGHFIQNHRQSVAFGQSSSKNAHRNDQSAKTPRTTNKRFSNGLQSSKNKHLQLLIANRLQTIKIISHFYATLNTKIWKKISLFHKKILPSFVTTTLESNLQPFYLIAIKVSFVWYFSHLNTHNFAQIYCKRKSNNNKN